MIEQLNQILQGICNWIAARNKVLWTGASKTGSITVPGLDDYDVISAEVNSYMCPVLMQRNSTGSFTGIGVSGVTSQLDTVCVGLLKTGNDTYTISTYSISHVSGGAHSEITQNRYGIIRIIGIEPIPKKIIWGGGNA